MKQVFPVLWSADDYEFGAQMYRAGLGMNWCHTDRQRDGWLDAQKQAKAAAQEQPEVQP